MIPTGHVRLFYRRALLPLAFDSSVLVEGNTLRNAWSKSNDDKVIAKSRFDRYRYDRSRGKKMLRKGRRIEERTRARRVVQRISPRPVRWSVWRPSRSPPFHTRQKEVAILTPTTITVATVIYQFIYCHAWINRWFADTRITPLVFLKPFKPFEGSTGFFTWKFGKILFARKRRKKKKNMCDEFDFDFHSHARAQNERWIFVERDITRPRIIRRLSVDVMFYCYREW